MKHIDFNKLESINPWEFTADIDGLRYISIALTQHCNFRCEFCSSSWAKKGLIKCKLIEKILNEGIELGLRKIELTGGEPTLHPYFWKILENIGKRGIQILLITNGSFIDNVKKIKKLVDYNVKIAVSIHTLNPNTFEALVGVSAKMLKKVILNIELMEKFLSQIWIRITPFKKNLKDIPKLIDWCLQRGHIPIFNIPTPKLINSDITSMINSEEYKFLLDYLGKKINIKHTIPFAYNVPCNRYLVGFHVSAEGYVFPCASVPLIIGNLEHNTIKDIWKNTILFEKMRDIYTNIKGKCRKCSYNGFCYGCRSSAFRNYGNVFEEDPMCWRKNSKQ
jgi:radical SAM protein with 4Fe4S-binding SPASM domain